MAITTAAAFAAAQKQRVVWSKNTARTSIAGTWFSLFDLAGIPAAGVLAGTDAVAGVVPTDAIAGYPPINTFAGSNRGYLSRVDYSNTTSGATGRYAVFDRLYVAGPFNFNDSITLGSQPSYSSRVPGGTDFRDLQIWVEYVTAATGNQAVSVNYTDQDGNAGATTGAVGIAAAPTVGRCWQLPLAAGDSGVQKIESVAGTVATAGTFNIMVLRPLYQVRVERTGFMDTKDGLATGLPEVFGDSAVYILTSTELTSSGTPDCNLQIAQG